MRHFAVLALLLALAFAGCADKGEATEVLPSETLPSETSLAPSPTEEPNNTFVPKFHTHDYWGGRQSLYLFNGDLQIGDDMLGQTTVSNSAVTLGTVTFDTKSDGDNVNTADATDVVFQGTKRIDVTVTWDDTNMIPGLQFSFKPANSPSFTLVGPLQSGKTASIYLRQGMADMPHQLSLSRWKFKLDAYDPQTSASPMKLYRARGTVGVEMKIFNGGEQFIDPPHPYFFTNGPTLYAGEVNQSFDKCLLVNNTRVAESQPRTSPVTYGCKLDEYQVPAPTIVPWETTKMVVDVYYNLTDPTAGAQHKLGLKFHGSDSSEYSYPKASESAAGRLRYEIPVTEAMTDSPYATQTDWRFGVYPIIGDQKDYGGDITGNLHIVATAFSDGTGSRGMGN